MKRDCDIIQIENRAELRELLRMVDKYYKAYPSEKDNEVVKQFYGMIDMMNFEW